ncbi:MAG TPA: helix-turn-helix domain-containing protein [Candidatus Dormibacteraeota bacterium]|nr:helix-turn-helix domain-containing protein [Candidatus Dormibacteraeota bacterium]
MRSDRTGAREWMSLHEASELLGISPTSLRRWADAGMVRTFVTPGGHRRFSREGLSGLLPAVGARPTMERLGETPERMQHVYRRAVAAAPEPMPWVVSLDADQRALFRGHGLVIVTSLLGALDATDETGRSAQLVAARDAAAGYGEAAARAGLPASVAVEVFLRFRRPFMAELSELGRRRGLDTTAVTDLLDRATDAFDELLVATVAALERTPGPQARATARPRARRAREEPRSARDGAPEVAR